MPNPSRFDDASILRAVGACIAEARAEADFTQAQIADHFDVDKGTVSRWECGLSFCGLGRIAELATLFDCAPASLLALDVWGRHTKRVRRRAAVGEA